MFYLVRHGHRHDHGSYHERETVNVTYDPKLTKIGEWMAFKTGMELIEEIGRDKEIMFISSPFYRCLQTSDFMLCGMISMETNVYKDQIFVEDLIREHAHGANFTKDDYQKLAFFKGEKVTYLDTAFNTLEEFRGFDELMNYYPEDDLRLVDRTELFINLVAKFVKKHPNVVPIVCTHGFSISIAHQMYGDKNDKCVPYYCGAVKFNVNKESGDIKAEYINKRFY